MSASEIADNKWELDSTKPKIANPGAIAQIMMMGGFMLFFAYIMIFSVIGMFSEKKEGSLEEKFHHMDDAKPAAAAPKDE